MCGDTAWRFGRGDVINSSSSSFLSLCLAVFTAQFSLADGTVWLIPTFQTFDIQNNDGTDSLPRLWLITTSTITDSLITETSSCCFFLRSSNPFFFFFFARISSSSIIYIFIVRAIFWCIRTTTTTAMCNVPEYLKRKINRSIAS